MSDAIDNATVKIPCPKCPEKTEKTIGWIKANHEFTCINGHVITLDADQFIREINAAAEATAQFKASLKKFGK